MIQVTNLTFSYPGSYDAVFDCFSFQFDTQWRLGFLGRNGRGKTTLLRLLMGQYEYGGSISGVPPCTYFPHPVSTPGNWRWRYSPPSVPRLRSGSYCGKADFWAWSPKHSTALLKLSPTASRPSAFWQPSFAGNPGIC